MSAGSLTMTAVVPVFSTVVLLWWLLSKGDIWPRLAAKLKNACNGPAVT
jgi:hypothetical protein